MTNDANIRPVIVEGWPLAFVPDAAAPEEPRIRDLDLGERLGFARPRDVRPLIDRLEDQGKIAGVCRRDTVSRRGFSEEIVQERWLTEAQALKVAAKSETDVADALLDDMIRVFMLARRGELPAQAPALTRRAAITFLVNEAMAEGKDGAAVALLNGFRALEKGQLPLVDIGPARRPLRGSTVAEAHRVNLTPFRDAILRALRRKPARSLRELRATIGGAVTNIDAAVRSLVMEGLVIEEPVRTATAPARGFRLAPEGTVLQ